MKKKYVKPEMFFEDFSLSTSIAGNCEVLYETIKNKDIPTPWDDMMIFITEKVCTKEKNYVSLERDSFLDVALSQNDGFCYHVPTDSKDLFNS